MASITSELRKYATVSWNPWPAARDWLYQMCDDIDAIHANLERENESLRRELDRVLGEQDDKALTYEEAKQLCMQAFDGGATYGSESTRYGVEARAYDWEHWLAKHDGLFAPKPTVEDVLRELLDEAEHFHSLEEEEEAIAEYAAKLRLAGVSDA